MARQTLLLCLAFLLSIPSKSQTILVMWNFEDENQFADAGIATNAGREITTNTTGAINYYQGSSGAGSFSIHSTKWNNGQDQKYWQINLSTEGYKGLNLSSKQRSSDRGPRDFKLQYSLDDQTWVDAGIEILVENNFSTGVLNNILLPSACNSQSILYIRWLVSSNVDVVETIIDPSGTSRIDDIIVTGSLIPVLTSPLTHSCCSGSPVNYIPSGSGNVFNWSRTTVAGILESASSGSGTINEILTNTTQLPVDVNYTFNLELNGVTNSQVVIVTINPTPDLDVSPLSQMSCPSSDILPISFSNPNQLNGTTFSWEWTGVNSEKLNLSPSGGTTSPINAEINSSDPATLVETSINITATSMQGCSVNHQLTISVGDNVAPSFTFYADMLNLCVEDISLATSNGVDDILEPRPDFYTFIPGDHSLDLDPTIFEDNCTSKDDLIIHWQIDLYQNSISVTGVGQPSSITTPIIFSGDPENIVYHKITYWLEDKYGNITPDGQRAVVTISVHPRPHINQNF
jgi:hypothetical protein